MSLLLWVVALGCVNSPPKTGPHPAPVVPSINAEPIPVPSELPDKDCMKTCLRQNMARAISAEVIEADCVLICSSPNQQHLGDLDASMGRQ